MNVSQRSTMSTRYGMETVSAADKKQNKDIDKIMTKYLNPKKGGVTIPNGLDDKPNYELIEQSKFIIQIIETKFHH